MGYKLQMWSEQNSIVTLDIGGTKINAGRYFNAQIESSISSNFNTLASKNSILDYVIHCITKQINSTTAGISIGVPAIVDQSKGIVYNAINIPSWDKIELKQKLQSHFNLPVYINNDVNCFTFGESQFGQAKGFSDIIGLCLGTGFGSGIVLNNQLYSGKNCSSGEIGSVQYKDTTFDDYCSGNFFEQHFNASGSLLAKEAKEGNQEAQRAFQEFGQHIAKGISLLLLILDPQLIVIGGSVSKSFDLFINSIWQSLNDFPYQNVVKNLSIIQSKDEDIALLGAAKLFINHFETEDNVSR